MKIVQLVTERRKNPTQNRTLGYVETIKRYANLKNSAEFYVSFTDVDKIGIRPIPQWTDTPIGVYAYPIEYVANTDGVRFSNRKYANIIRATQPPFNSSPPNPEVFSRAQAMYKQYMIDRHPEEVGDSWFEDELEYYFGTPMRDSTQKSVFDLASLTASMTKRYGNPSPHYVLWNTLLRMVGIRSIVDNGEGFIYNEEPVQAVFLDNTSYELVERVPTNQKTR